jgi:hypothetical protein
MFSQLIDAVRCLTQFRGSFRYHCFYMFGSLSHVAKVKRQEGREGRADQ